MRLFKNDKNLFLQLLLQAFCGVVEKPILIA